LCIDQNLSSIDFDEILSDNPSDFDDDNSTLDNLPDDIWDDDIHDDTVSD
jgi:hypothetical protein